MRRLLVGLAALALTLSLGLTATLAASPTQQQADCAAQGGTYEKVGGTVTCTIIVVDPVGNSESSGGHSQETTTTGGESTNGNLDNNPQSTPLPEECTGPQGQCK
jgi:hypothetical protein